MLVHDQCVYFTQLTTQAWYKEVNFIIVRV